MQVPTGYCCLSIDSNLIPFFYRDHSSSDSTTMQIDNQMQNAVFPVTFCQVPPPKSVAADSGLYRIM